LHTRELKGKRSHCPTLLPARLNYSKNYAVESSITDECLGYYKDLCKAKLPQLPIIMKAKVFSGRIEKIKEVGRICPVAGKMVWEP
uniref:Uncharacterized protein n=1 Tax=Chelonoidis abingdonii TaxID=106734 RepID=A0A8C0FZ06_CHEAB